MLLCTPALIYLILGILGIVIYFFTMQNTLLSVAFQIGFVLAWTWFLNYLCRSGLSMLSWVLVLLPLLSIFVMYTTTIDLVLVQPTTPPNP